MAYDSDVDSVLPLLEGASTSSELLSDGYDFVKAYKEVPVGQDGSKVERAGVLDIATTMEAKRRTVNAAADYIENSWETDAPITDLVVALKGGSVLTRDVLLELERRRSGSNGASEGRELNVRFALKVNSSGMADAQYSRDAQTRYILSDTSPIEGRALMIDDIIDTVESLKGIQSAVNICGSKIENFEQSILVAFSPFVKGEDKFFNKLHALDLLAMNNFTHENIWDHKDGDSFNPNASVFTCLTCEGVWIDTGNGLASDQIKPQNEIVLKRNGITIPVYDITQPISLTNKPTLQQLVQMGIEGEYFLARYAIIDADERLTPACIKGEITDVDTYSQMLSRITERELESCTEPVLVREQYDQLHFVLLELIRQQIELEFAQIRNEVLTSEQVVTFMRDRIFPIAKDYFQRFSIVGRKESA